jgi:uncharacterized protein (DUF1697 family)
MTIFAALLRAINVGGTGKLAMSDLTRLCEEIGFVGAKTYIQSGNVLFESALPEAKALALLEKALTAHMGKPVGVLLRSAAELEAAIAENPFRDAAPNRVLILFLPRPEPQQALANIQIPGREALKLVGRELFIHYPDGMGGSKLKVPLAKLGTGRNLNTLRKLAEMARQMSGAKRAAPRAAAGGKARQKAATSP